MSFILISRIVDAHSCEAQPCAYTPLPPAAMWTHCPVLRRKLADLWRHKSGYPTLWTHKVWYFK